MPTYAKERTGAAPNNRMTPERAMRNAMMKLGWPEAVAWPKLKKDRDLAAQIFRDALETRPMDEWISLDLLELARYSKLMVQLMRAQDEMADLGVGTRAHATALKTVGQMSIAVQRVGRQLYLHKVINNPSTAAQQAATARQMRQTIEGQAEQVTAAKARPRLIA